MQIGKTVREVSESQWRMIVQQRNPIDAFRLL